ncbi:MAG: hypothetical protein LUF86_06755, partial [Clostridiales bacterium]|nr:hypothetical protein [Clostridiales bacterium]
VLMRSGAEILLTDALQNALSYSFYAVSGSDLLRDAEVISGSDPVVAEGSGYTLASSDLAMLVYNDSGSPRALTLEDNAAVLCRTELTESMVSLPGADNSSGTPVVTASWDSSAVTPAVQVTSGETVVDEGNYTVTYTDNTIPSTAKAGDLLDASLTVTGQNDFLDGSVTLAFQILVGDYIDLGTQGSAAITYSAAEGYVITVTCNGATLTAGTDYTVSYAIDTKNYVTTVTVSGKGNYGGSITLTVDILGQQSAVAYVTNEQELTAALEAGTARIILANDISVDSAVEIDYAVILDGQGKYVLSAGEALTTAANGTTDDHKTAALLSVSETGALTLTGITVDGSDQVRCLYTAGTVEMTGGAVLTGGGLDGQGTSERGLAAYIDETGSLTVTDGEIRDVTDYIYVSSIVNLGTLTLEDGAYLTNLPSTYSAILNLGTLNWCGATFDVNLTGYYSNNTYSGTSAGAVIENQGEFNMTGGLLNGYLLTSSGSYSSTCSTAYFGGVHNADSGVFILSLANSPRESRAPR